MTRDSSLWVTSVCMCWANSGCSCTPSARPKIFTHQAWTRSLGSAVLVLVLVLYGSTNNSLAAATRLYTLAQKKCNSDPYFSRVIYFLMLFNADHTLKKKVTICCSFLAKSKSSSTVSKWTGQHEVFLKKASYNICVRWSLCWVIISVVQQRPQQNTLFVLPWLFLFLLLEIMLPCLLKKKKKKAIEMFTFTKGFFLFFPRPIFLLNSADSTRQFLHNPTKRQGKLNEIFILVNAVYLLHRLNLCAGVKHRWFAHLQVNHDKTAAK